jgi:O-acetylserine/cysteine efflux transporter
MRPWHLIVLLVLNAAWSATLVINKALGLDNDHGPQLDPGAIVTLRFALAALSLVVVWPWLPGRAPRGRNLALTVLIGLLVFVLGQRLQVLGVKLGTAGNSAVLMGLEPLLTTVAAAIFLREHLGPRRLLGSAISLAGLAVLNEVWRPEFQWTGLVPSLIFVSSFLCETAFSILGKPILERASPTKVVTVALLAGTLVNFLLDGSQTLRVARTLEPEQWVMLSYMAIVCTSVGYAMWFVVIREAPVSVVALTIFVQPVAGVGLAAWYLREPLHWGQLWGSLAIIAGVAVGLSHQILARASNKAPAAAAPGTDAPGT